MPHPRPLLAAAAALAATVVLGQWGAPFSPWLLRDFASFGLAVVACVGTLAYHFARLTEAPRGVAAALPAALIPLALLPGLGLPALFVPAVLLWRQRDDRMALLLALSCFLPLAIAAALWCVLRDALGVAANDNPPMERGAPIWVLPPSPAYANGWGD